MVYLLIAGVRFCGDMSVVERIHRPVVAFTFMIA